MNNNKTYFAEVAGDWDEIRSGYFTEGMRDAAIALANLNQDSIVADIGTGTGFVIQGLADKVANVYGFDPSAEMLDVAAQNLAAFDNIKLEQAPGHNLPLADEAVDAVFGNMYLHHDSDPAVAIVELARILKTGGKLVLTDLDAHEEAWMHEEM
ncbi:MAG: class I SAM-dependent methyltransferase, partial [Chloroflexota bacterium]